MKTKMETKKTFGFFVVVLTSILLFAAASVSAVVVPDFSVTQVTVDGVSASGNLALVAGDTVTVKVYFDSVAVADLKDVKVRLELNGNDVNVAPYMTSSFDVLAGKSYVKTITLKVPNQFGNDVVSESMTLDLKISGGDSVESSGSFDLSVQRPSYNVDFVSVGISGSAQAGTLVPVDVVLKNTGYNKLNDLYVTVRVPELGLEKSAYFGDLFNVLDVANNTNNNNNVVDVTHGRIFLDVPYSAKDGVYTVEVEAKNSDLDIKKVGQFTIGNGLASNVMVTGNSIVIANPSSQLLTLRLVPESKSNSAVTLSEDLVVVPAGTSKTVTASSVSGEAFNVNVFSKDGALLDSVTMPASATTSNTTGSNAVAVLTVILTIVFLVLLVVLVVLITKKPQKSEEFSESYY